MRWAASRERCDRVALGGARAVANSGSVLRGGDLRWSARRAHDAAGRANTLEGGDTVRQAVKVAQGGATTEQSGPSECTRQRAWRAHRQALPRRQLADFRLDRRFRHHLRNRSPGADVAAVS
jgi:hypothetical protein